MPSQQGDLTKKEQQKFARWMQKKDKDYHCEICGSGSFDLGVHVLTPSVFAKKAKYLHGVSYPSIPIFCSNCGNTKFISAIRAGIIPIQRKRNPQKSKRKNAKKKK